MINLLKNCEGLLLNKKCMKENRYKTKNLNNIKKLIILKKNKN